MSGQVTYHHPTIGPKAYMARGSSGWSETFGRIAADEELKKILGTVPLLTAVTGFRNQKKLTKAAIEWPTIIDYLAFICQCEVKLIIDAAGVAFWCQVILAEREAHKTN